MRRKERYGFSIQCLSVLSQDTCGDSFGLAPELDSSSYLYFTIRAQIGSGKKDTSCAVEGKEKSSEVRGSNQLLIFTSIIHLSMIFFFKFYSVTLWQGCESKVSIKTRREATVFSGDCTSWLLIPRSQNFLIGKKGS